MVRITQLPAETTPTSDDLLAMVDNAGAITKKVTIEDLASGFEIGSIDGDKLKDNSVTADKIDFSNVIFATGSGSPVPGQSNSAYQYKAGMPTATFTLGSSTTAYITATCFIQQSGSGTGDLFASIYDNGTTKLSNDHVFTSVATGNGGNISVMVKTTLAVGSHTIDIRNLRVGSVNYTVYPERSSMMIILTKNPS